MVPAVCWSEQHQLKATFSKSNLHYPNLGYLLGFAESGLEFRVYGFEKIHRPGGLEKSWGGRGWRKVAKRKKKFIDTV